VHDIIVRSGQRVPELCPFLEIFFDISAIVGVYSSQSVKVLV